MRGDKERKGNRKETNRIKGEGWGKQTKRENENVSGLKTKSEKKRNRFCIEVENKFSSTKAKAQHNGKKLEHVG